MSINLDIKQGFVSMGNHNMDYANAQESMNLFAHGRSVAYGNTYDESYDYLKKVYQGYGANVSTGVQGLYSACGKIQPIPYH